MGENHFAPWTVDLYGVVLLFAAIAYYILARVFVRSHGKESALAIAVGRDFKGKVSVLIYFVAILLAFINAALACLLYVFVAIMWLIPDRRIERTLIP